MNDNEDYENEDENEDEDEDENELEEGRIWDLVDAELSYLSKGEVIWLLARLLAMKVCMHRGKEEVSNELFNEVLEIMRVAICKMEWAVIEDED